MTEWIDNFIVSSTYAEGNRLGSVNITVPSGLVDSMLLAIVSGRSTDTNPEHITGFTWEGSGFSSFVAHDQYDYNGQGEYYVWYLLNPDAATAQNVTIAYNLSRNHDTLAEIHVLKNVTQQAPQSLVIATSAGVTYTNSSITCAIDDLLFCFTALENSISSPVMGTDQTQLTHQYYSNTQASSYLSSWKRAGTTSESMQHSWTTSRDFRQGSWAIATEPIETEGTLEETLDPFTLSATGILQPISLGTLEEALDAFTLTGTGTGLSSFGVLDKTLDAFTLIAGGTGLSSFGVLDKTLDAFTLAGTGKVIRPAGFFSPDHPDAMPGFAKGMKVKVEVDETVKFVGRVAAIRPTSGLFEYPTVEIEVHDWMGYLLDQELGIQAVAETKRADEALTTVLTSFPIQPESTDFDTGVETFLLIFDTESPKSSMASFFQKLCRNEMGRIYTKGDGTLVFENRNARKLITTPDFDLDGIMTELRVSHERKDIFNVIQAVINPVEASPNADVLLWDLKVAEYFGGVIPSIAAGETLVLECPFTDPALDINVTAINVVDPIEVIEFGSVADFESNNLIDYLDITQVIGANKTIVSMTNTHGSTTGYLNDLQIYGRALYSYGSRTVESRDQASIDSGIGERRFTLRLDEITDAIDALALATHVHKRYADSHIRSKHIKFLANQSEALLADAIAIEPSTRFTATESVTGIDQDFFVNRVKYSIIGQQLWVEILADPVRSFTSEGTLTRSLASVTLAGTGTVV